MGEPLEKNVILKDRPDEGPKAKVEVKTLDYIATHTNIPVSRVIRDWVDRDGRYFVLNARVRGQTLEEAWNSLSESQKVDVADQVCVDQSPCYPGLLFFELEPRGPFHSDQELWDALAVNLRQLPEQVLGNLKKRLPKCEPYVLTHCDLNLGNIMVRDGKVVGILYWEYAAFFPIWYDHASASFGFTDTDVERKRLLRERLRVHGEAHEDAKALWTDMCNLRQYPNLDEKGQETLEKLS
ncbi:aminoglycoside phosphotransferase family protein [Aspergillus lucknowensis]|uniref:Kinase-like domain-containing protein n=1 Tax=Aspergillus lucknowensis TaxID=176173 RepID=A0ABR4M524_9EURO